MAARARRRATRRPDVEADPFEATAPLFVAAELRTAGRLAKAARALHDARVAKRAHADPRWAERALAMLGVVLPYPKSVLTSDLHDQAAQLLLEMRPPGASPRLAALLAERLAPHHRILRVLGSLGDDTVVETICDWFEAKDSTGACGVQVYAWDALVALGAPRVVAVLTERLDQRTLNRHVRWTYAETLAMIARGDPRPNRVDSIVSP